MARSVASPATTLATTLRSFETGGVAFGDVLEEVQRLLIGGASAAQLMETLHRREAIEPLAEQAYVRISGLLNEAMQRQASEAPSSAELPGAKPRQEAELAAEPPLAQLDVEPALLADFALEPSHAESAALARAALQAERDKTLEIEKALSESTASAEAARSRAEQALRESERYQSEVQTLRDVLAARDVALGNSMHALGQRDTELVVLREKLADAMRALETHARADAQRETDLRAARVQSDGLGAELKSVRAALDAAHRKAQDTDEALLAGAGATEAARLRSEEAVRESRRLEAEAQYLRGSLAARDAELAALQQEHARVIPELQARINADSQLHAELRAAQSRVEALSGELAAAQAALQAEQSRAHTVNDGPAEAALLRVEQALQDAERHEAEAERLRGLLATRDAELATLRRENTEVSHALEGRIKASAQLETELKGVRSHAGTVAVALKKQEDAAEERDAKLKLAEARLNAFRIELDTAMAHNETAGLEGDVQQAARSPSNQSRVELTKLTSELDSIDAFVDKMRVQPGADAPLVAEPRTSKYRRNAEWVREWAGLNAPESAQAPQASQGPHGTKPVRAAAVRAKLAPQVAISESAQRAPVAPVPDADAHLNPRVKAWLAGSADRGTAALRGAAAWGGAAAVRGASALRAGGWKPLGRTRAISLGLAVAATGLIAFLIYLAQSHKSEPAPSAAAPEPGSVIRDCPTCPAMTVLPAGRYKQGTAGAGPETPAVEKPQHWVRIAGAFAMSTNTVTVAEFRRFIAATGRDMKGCDTYNGQWKHRPENNWREPGFNQTVTHPVTCVSWNDAATYAQWLSTETGHRYRLPSASEWEYAALGGGEAVQPWGASGSEACKYANVADQNAAQRYPGWEVFDCEDGYIHTAPVGSFMPNAFGLNDMLGNVFQWTGDCWHDDYSGAPVDGAARTDGDCSTRELRGGSWFSTPAYVRANFRNHFAVDYRTSSVGIRLVRELAP